MKRSLLIIGLSIILVGCILFPFFANRTVQESLSKGLAILSSVCLFLTLAIAFLLFNKYGIERTLLEKQTGAVFILIDELKKIRLVMQTENSILLFTTEREKLDFFKSGEYAKKVILFNVRYLESMMEISKALENAFMPKSIIDQFAPLRVRILSAVPNSEVSNKYITIDPPASSAEKEKNIYGNINNQEITLQQYADDWKNLIIASEDWLQKNSDVNVKLNI
jgi:hypothetical protein